jgi:uncharacterized protein with ParB-like and HNH nuclease domain/predicted transport protein
MKATEAKLLAFLKKSPQFVIPIYQRTYSWTEQECRQLWEDVLRCGADDRIQVHFVGSIVYIEDGLSQVTNQAPLLVIDGQQRLTTVSLLLAALVEAVPADAEPADGFSRRKIQNYYLLNPEEEGERRFKLLLSQTDKDTLVSIVAGRDRPREESLRISENFRLFREWLAAGEAPLETVCKGISKLVVVDIALSRGQDNPQLIFESMNSTGKELSQADLIRNFILMGLELEPQRRLYADYWRPMEVEFGQAAYGVHFDAFMRHFLTVKTGVIPKVGEVYEAFKAHARSPEGEAGGVEGLLREVRDYARHYCAMALGAERDPELHRAFQDLRELRVDVAYPLLLQFYADHAAGRLGKADFLAALRLVEAYVFRRAVCAIPTNSLNKTFAAFGKAIRRDRYLESVKAQLQLLPSYRRFPVDEEFARALQAVDVYNKNFKAYCLRKLENHGRKEPVSIGEYTIEHIMPQNEDLPAGWRSDLGQDWERVHKTFLHTLGNLTLTGYNSEYSDRPFREKRDMEGGFRHSPLRLNEGLGSAERWDEAGMLARAARLASTALKVWEGPQLAGESLAAYAPESRAPARAYGIADHPHIAAGPMEPVFQALRRSVLDLNPCVTEEFLKLYVAYKAETNFVDVEPQAKRLRLSLNIPFADIDDPRGICRDIAGVGRWGNGDVEVGLSSAEDLPYVMGLVRQALDRQLGGEAS